MYVCMYVCMHVFLCVSVCGFNTRDAQAKMKLNERAHTVSCTLRDDRCSAGAYSGLGGSK
jgi:hypothetical protein